MSSWIRKVKLALLALGAVAMLAPSLLAQGVSTGAIAGVVTDQDGGPVAGANVVVVSQPTGFSATTTTRATGSYLIQGLEPGGPYNVSVHLVGYRPERRGGVRIPLAATYRADFRLTRSPIEVEELVATADPLAATFAPSATGPATTINSEDLVRLPSLDHQFTDFVKLTPQVAERDGEGGLAVVGQNNRFNTIQIDGSTVNDRFGLGRTGLSGGQAGGKAIGLDAVKEYQVLLAPYDVRQGNFTGALINAVTKNGTNDYEASAYGYFRNQAVVGDPLSDTDFKRWQFGASIGGPIMPDKAHFFVNAEFQRASVPAGGPYIGAPASIGGIQPLQADVDAFNNALAAKGLPTGDALGTDNSNPLSNLTARVDVAAGERSRLVLRYSFNAARDEIFFRTTSTSNPVWDLSTYGYNFKNRTHNPSVQLFTNFANGNSNELRISLNRIRDRRTPFAIAPTVIVGGFTDGSGNSYRLRSGGEQFSQGNELDQDIWELTDNFTIPLEKHTITVGTRNEIYKVRNQFAQSSYGVWVFNDLADFQSGAAGLASSYDIAANRTGTGVPGEATFTSGILGLYAQDQWRANENLTLTFGLRADMPVFFDQPTYDPQVTTDFGPDLDVPSGKVLLAPRVGFNLNLPGQSDRQLRGGVGLFTGTPAYVWMSNAFANNGTGLVILGGGPRFGDVGPAPAFNPSATSPTIQCDNGVGIDPNSTFLGEVDIVGKDTKYPRVLRANLAFDTRLPEDIVATVEGILTKGINDYFIVNRNLPAPVGTDAAGRTMYGTIQPNDGRPSTSYFNSSVYGTGSGGVYELRNTSKNYSWNATAQLRKAFGQALRASASYTYSQSKDVASFTSSRAISNWRFGRVTSGEDLVDTRETSSFDRPHRIVLSGTYRFPWQNFGTELSLTYIGQSGQPYTLIAGGSSGRGDLNADGTNGNDPIYIPTGVSDPLIQFADPTQAAAFDTFISGESCLAEQRGSIMQRNSCRNPWQNFLDMSLRQELPYGANRLTLEISLFNVLNLLDSDWGQVKSAGGGEFYTQTILNLDTADASGNPIFSFNEPSERFTSNGRPINSWQLQFSARYNYR